jgi:hypothetical protein
MTNMKYRPQVLAPALMAALAFNKDLPTYIHQQLLELFSNDRLFQQGKRLPATEEVFHIC